MGDARPRFTLGQLVATPGALQALADAGQSPLEFIQRHQAKHGHDLLAPRQLW
jgi:hypothetical protein